MIEEQETDAPSVDQSRERHESEQQRRISEKIAANKAEEAIVRPAAGLSQPHR